MTTQKFSPNRLTFEEGLERILQAVDKVGLKTDGRLISSRDGAAFKLRDIHCNTVCL